MIKYSVFLFAYLFTFQIASAQWTEQVSGVTSTLYSVSAVDNNVVWACGASDRVLKTTNGGENWSTFLASPITTLDLYNIWGVDANTAIVTGSTTSTFVYKTTNGGSVWTEVFTQTGGFMNAIFGLSGGMTNLLAMVGDPVGGRWSIWYSSNTGSTWDSTGLYLVRAASEAGWNNSGVAFPLAGTNTAVWFGTSNTRVYYSTNFQTFVSQPTTGLTNTYSVWFNDSLRGMVGGGTGLQSTVNSGANWTPVVGTLGSGNVNGITGAGNDWWYVRGNSVFYSSNNGLNWVSEYTAPAGTHQHISKSRTGSSMWAVRSNGGIARSLGPIGIEPISSEVPVSYVLHQNYPNPFNPSTSIKFELPRNSFAKLIVYDALGREVAQVINEELRAGIYEVQWNSESYSSGIYYYTLTSGSFTETKKMILLK